MRMWSASAPREKKEEKMHIIKSYKQPLSHQRNIKIISIN